MLILDHLCHAIARRALLHPAKLALLRLAGSRIRALAFRFARLAIRAAQGRATPRRRPRPSAPPPADPPTDATPARPRQRLPDGYAWLYRLVPEAAHAGSQLEHLLNQPEIAALLEAAPHAARMLRPLCRMLLPFPTNVTTLDVRPRKRVRPPRRKPPPAPGAVPPAPRNRPPRPPRPPPAAPPPPTPTAEPAPRPLPRGGWVGIVSFRGEI